MKQVEDKVFIDDHWWIVTMTTTEYMTLEREDKPSVWRTIRRY